ncbi:IMP-specific 5-nucleotidase [Piedraia hortae CBS 480.64]|uniref:IMP-specific 5'-nucleotidase 1 n=1 Tax=Piedraia hortae CBS 480.64 TaxID=1314780 RepID=A0A6A7BZB5_9PEZI|nr:IMP-specific 5-nucleotidase [Piedraia hortae CBS 480.64]
MTTRYRVEYSLKTHRRDQFIEWIKGAMAVPFVLLAHPGMTGTSVDREDHETTGSVDQSLTRSRYGQILRDIERLIAEHRSSAGSGATSRLQALVPSIGQFFTQLPLQDAFEYQDAKRIISARRFVAPSFNDIRLILNTAQIMALVREARLELITFDGDVTLYNDGEALTPTSECILRIMALMRRGVRVGIVTAAGYEDAESYHGRLYGLLEALAADETFAKVDKGNLIVMGGEANYLFAFDADTVPSRLKRVEDGQWKLPEMAGWTEEAIADLLDVAEQALKRITSMLRMKVKVVRKPRAVGIIPADPKARLPREQLEETVLFVQRTLEHSAQGRKIPFCAFNGGNDVFVDIGDKSWGVRACQSFFGGIHPGRSLHVGDQFLSAGSNDFKARLASTTAWIANPEETCQLLDEAVEFMDS